LVLGLCGAASAAPLLRVCVLENNAPYSDRATARGFDIDVAQAVAKLNDWDFKAVWSSNATTITEIDDSDFPLARLARSECDAIFSLPGPAKDSLDGREKTLTLGDAYYGAAFELVTCSSNPVRDLQGLKGQKVAIQSQTVAHFALLKVAAEPQSYFSVPKALYALSHKEAEVGLLWGPTLGWQLRNLGVSGELRRDAKLAQCGFVAGYAPAPALRWNLHVATRTGEPDRRREIDEALRQISASGEFDTIKGAYGMPLRAPFETAYSIDAMQGLGTD